MRSVTIAATQMACTWDIEDNLSKAEAMVRDAAGSGAQIILLQELFETPYFCIEQSARHFELAKPFEQSPVIARFGALAAELGVVLPISWFEQAGLARFNALAIVDADGTHLTTYRKSHIPQFPGYEEKYYFSPGDTGFQVVQTQFGKIGCGICWDQWFPETARALALQGAELLLYPTAIGSEPAYPELDSAGHWRRAMQGHAAANVMPVIASNRVGTETAGNLSMEFYGTSFIAGYTGEILVDAGRQEETVITATIDLDEAATYRRNWGVFRDRRPDLYGALATLDGRS